jgi:hypothetical protein
MSRVGHVGLDEGRLEQTRVQLAHLLCGADCGEVGRPLVPPVGAERVAECEQHQGARQDRAHDPQHQQRRLAALAADPLNTAE